MLFILELSTPDSPAKHLPIEEKLEAMYVGACDQPTEETEGVWLDTEETTGGGLDEENTEIGSFVYGLDDIPGIGSLVDDLSDEGLSGLSSEDSEIYDYGAFSDHTGSLDYRGRYGAMSIGIVF